MRVARVRGPGHPDQACDQVAAAIVEEYIRRDSASRLEVRVSGGRGALFVAGEVISQADFDVSSVVRRTLGGIGSMGAMEPFIAFETLSPQAAPVFGAREVVQVMGYATDETPELLPRPIVCARQLARGLEHRRLNDPEWFWLGADYDVTVFERDGHLSVVVRAEHAAQFSLLQVRATITQCVKDLWQEAETRVNAGGEEVRGGLSGRMGMSDQRSPMEMYGSHIPCPVSRVGMHASHPSIMGSWMARQIARERVREGRGKAVMVEAMWLPFETRPQAVRIRNERGENLSSEEDWTRFDLSRLQVMYPHPSLVSQSLVVGYDSSVQLPWEQGS